MYEDLYKAWKMEKENADIQALPRDFYAKLAEYVKKMRKESRMLDKKTTKGRLMERELRNVNMMVEGLIRLRYEKALERTMKEKTVPKGILMEEEKLQGEILPSAEAYEALLKSVLRGSLTRVERKGQQRQMVVRFLREVPAIIGSDMKPYGPFKVEDVASLPVENARILIRQGAALEVETK